MGDLLNYQSDKMSIVELLEQGIHFSHHLLRNFNIQQGEPFPVIAQSEEPTICIINWGIENPILPQGPGLTYIYGPSIEKQESLKNLFRHQRVLIPVSKFIHRRGLNEPNVTIEHPYKRMLWMGGVWYEGQRNEKGFALITHNNIDQKRNEIRRIPVFINQPEVMKQWLDCNDSSLIHLNKILNSRSELNLKHESIDMLEL